jgi:hypothetical protein
VDDIVFKQNGVVRMTKTNQFDLLNRLTGQQASLSPH